MFHSYLLSRLYVCCLLCFIPCTVSAQVGVLGIVRGADVSVNQQSVPHGTAVFVGDIVETVNGIASFTGPGVNVLFDKGTSVQVLKDAFELKHGAVSVVTLKAIPVISGPITARPSSKVETKFWVADVGDSLRIQAQKGSVIVQGCSRETNLLEGQEGRRRKSTMCQKSGMPAPAAMTGILDSKTAIIGGAAVIGIVTSLVLRDEQRPASPSAP